MQKSSEETPSKSLLLGTRASPLAVLQTKIIQKKLAALGVDAELELIKTKGDRVQDKPLSEIGGKGVFIKELEASLLSGESDLAVHSLKDLPCHLHESFELVAHLKRDFPHDVMILRKEKNPFKTPLEGNLLEKDFKSLAKIKIATGSLRRKALLLEANPELEICPIRGNIGTRLGKLENKDCDALILSEASIKRLPFDEDKFIFYILDPDWFIPCAGQGVIAVEALKKQQLGPKLKELSCEETVLRCNIERGLLAALGGSCLLPIGVYCTHSGNKLTVRSLVTTEDASLQVRHKEIFGETEPVESIVQKMKEALYDKNVNAILKALGIPPISL